MRARPAFNSDKSSGRETFERRLAEARAFAEASDGLSTRFPELSARGGLSIAQRLFGWTLTIAGVTLLFVNTGLATALFFFFIAFVFATVIAIRIMATILAMAPRRTSPEMLLPPGSLPVITLLVPLYREASVVPELLEALGRLDYPPDRLDVKILIEIDDPATLAALEAFELPDHFEVIPAPPGEPRTKPKALNYGLAFARGEFVAVFDAEDRPAPGQPRAAIAAFRKGGAKLAVVQAPLRIHNGDDGWLAGQFELEYAIHFRVWLPFLAAIGMPLALGGTSNYFRRDVLVAAGGWDAWNVTEDADIGIRLARLGHSAVMIEPPTDEEAPSRLKPWMNQRTRWMKGYLQTWLVLNRHPIKAARGMGLVNFLATQVTLGGALLAALVHGPLWLWIIVNAFSWSGFEAWHIALFSLGYGSALAAGLASGLARGRRWSLVTLPLYWPLQSAAMFRALIEMKRNPHHWAKTPHGQSPNKAPAAVAPARPEIVESLGDLAGGPPGDNVIQLEFRFPDPA